MGKLILTLTLKLRSEVVDWIDLAQGRDQRRAIAKRVIKF
jgi:hypothetical protein